MKIFIVHPENLKRLAKEKGLVLLCRDGSFFEACENGRIHVRIYTKYTMGDGLLEVTAPDLLTPEDELIPPDYFVQNLYEEYLATGESPYFFNFSL